MDFTEIYRQSSGLVIFSPGAHFILTAVADRLIVRRADSFHVSRSWQVSSSPSPSVAATAVVSLRPPKAGRHIDNITQTPVISHIGWSSDSEYVLAACAKSGSVCVFRMRDEEWSAKIDSGAEGLLKAEWAPDGRHILCFSEWAVSYAHYSPPRAPTLSIAAESHHMVTCHRYSNIHTISHAPGPRYESTRVLISVLSHLSLAKATRSDKTGNISFSPNVTNQRIRSAYTMLLIRLDSREYVSQRVYFH